MDGLDQPVRSIEETFAQDGCYLARNVFSEARLTAMQTAFDDIVRQLQSSGEDINARWDSESTDAIDGGGTTILHTHNVHRYSSVWLHALLDEGFLGVAERILGPDIILHHTKLFVKPPKTGAPFPIHQDWWYFPTRRDSMIAGVIFLDDADEDVGGFRVYPGSHTLGRQDNTSGLERNSRLDQYPLDGATPINAKRGDVLFFSYFTLHGSTPNRSDRTRRTVLVQMYRGDDVVLENEDVKHVDERLVLKGWNHHMNRARASGSA